MDDGFLCQHGEPCAARVHGTADEVVEAQEVEVSGNVGTHGVHDCQAHLPQGLDCVELSDVLV